MKKIKYRNIVSETVILQQLKNSCRKTYCKTARTIRIEKKSKRKIQLYKKIDLAVAFLNFYNVKRGYKYFYQQKILKRKNIKKPKYKKMNVKIKRHSYTREELLNIIFSGLKLKTIFNSKN
ncbi:hypothetical protein HUW86_09570 [Fusobacterium sp. SB021]|uniref:hypothetical protein n=1 Tax=Fusobacterium sp. SB021 TaxID=2744227 RepID=UPI003CE84094